MTYNITLTANHQSLTAEYLPLAAESVQYLTAKVVCETEDWTGREIKAMFGQGCTVHEVPVTGGEITAKQQLNLTAGDWHVWLVGNSARDGEVIPRITTNIAHISVDPTGGTEGNPFPTIPPTAEEQLRADMGNLADLTTKDKSSLVAAINEAAASGGSKDAVTYTPQTLTVEQQAQARTNIGALDVNIETTPVDIGVGLGGRVENIYYVKSGWLKPCPDNADNELILQYRRVFDAIGLQRAEPNSEDILLRAKSAYSLYQKGLASESITVTNDPLNATRVYVTWNIVTRSNKHYIYYAQVSTSYNYNCTYCVEDDALTNESYRRAIDSNSYGVGKQSSVPQFRMSANPTEDMHVATKQYVDTAKTEAQQLGLTAATPGQIIKVKAVQDGKPTEWEAVDMPGGGETWEKVADIELRADTALYVLADFAVWRKAKVIMRRPTYVSGLAKNVWCRVVGKNNVAAAYYSCGYLVAEYGYSYWDFSAEVSSNVISSVTLRNNNTNDAANVRSTQTLTPINLPPTAYALTLTFVDTSVIQDGDKVTVIGVRR